MKSHSFCKSKTKNELKLITFNRDEKSLVRISVKESEIGPKLELSLSFKFLSDHDPKQVKYENLQIYELKYVNKSKETQRFQCQYTLAY